MGGGTMGAGIAQVCAQSGLRVTLCEVSDAALAKAVKGISWSVGKLIEKGKLKGDLDEIMSRITPTVSIKDAAGADLVVEAVFENAEVKREVFAGLSPVIS